MQENYNTEFKQSWRDEYLRPYVRLPIHMAAFYMLARMMMAT